LLKRRLYPLRGRLFSAGKRPEHEPKILEKILSVEHSLGRRRELLVRQRRNTPHREHVARQPLRVGLTGGHDSIFIDELHGDGLALQNVAALLRIFLTESHVEDRNGKRPCVSRRLPDIG
jgi:hypothetical protein